MPIASTSLRALLIAGIAAGALTTLPTTARAGDGGAFVGGLIAGHVVTRVVDNSERRARAAERQADRPTVVYQQAPPPQQQQQAAPAQQTPQQRLDTLDKLAAQGYISKEEYQRRRQEILNSL